MVLVLCVVIVELNCMLQLLHGKNFFISNVILFYAYMALNTSLHLDFMGI